MNGRHELKYSINAADCAQIRARLRAVAKLDENARVDGSYKIRSLYFDNYSDKAVTEKLSGISKREKYRLRLYNGDISFIRLERKSKQNRLTYKESAAITAKEVEKLLTGDYSALKHKEQPLLMELYAKIMYQNLRPMSIVEYSREAYIYPVGNVRVTFDSEIKTTNNIAVFLQENLVAIPAIASIVLEIKYDGFIPDIIRDCVKIAHRSQSEYSKYVAARMV